MTAPLCWPSLHCPVKRLCWRLHRNPVALQAPGILITPHIGGAVRDMRVRGYDFVLKQLARYLAKEPLENVRLHGY